MVDREIRMRLTPAEMIDELDGEILIKDSFFMQLFTILLKNGLEGYFFLCPKGSRFGPCRAVFYFWVRK